MDISWQTLGNNSDVQGGVLEAELCVGNGKTWICRRSHLMIESMTQFEVTGKD